MSAMFVSRIKQNKIFFCKRRIDGYNCRIDGYIDYFKKSIKIFDVPSVPR